VPVKAGTTRGVLATKRGVGATETTLDEDNACTEPGGAVVPNGKLESPRSGTTAIDIGRAVARMLTRDSAGRGTLTNQDHK